MRRWSRVLVFAAAIAGAGCGDEPLSKFRLSATAASAGSTSGTGGQGGQGAGGQAGAGGAASVCGDGVLSAGEACDDGNLKPADGCSPDCQVEPGFSCAGEPSTCACAPSTFLACDGTTAVACDASGHASTAKDCGAAGCVDGTGCGPCAQSSCVSGDAGAPATFTTCEGGAVVAAGTCDLPFGGQGSPAACNETACLACAAGGCGDGTHGTDPLHSYSCTGGELVDLGASACRFGCDDHVGCRDLIPASRALEHLAQGDELTCIGGQSAILPALDVPAMGTALADTSSRTVSINGATVIGVRWGAAYTPDGSPTPATVLHVKRLTLGPGATFTARGSSALILLVDGDVTATGGGASPTVISAASSGFSTPGAGALLGAPTGPGAPALGGSPHAGGCGGAGHLGHGGRGGDSGTALADAGHAGGGVYGVAAGTEVLAAGTSGGRCAGASGANAGGLGGGALQISACGTITIGAGVIVDVSGGGGQGNHAAVAEPGGGGGSGGTLILEASALQIAGILAANGGGGGAGTASCAANGATWSGATMSPATPAPGGACAKGPGASGGAGASIDGLGALASPSSPGGGGGGAVGAIFLNLPAHVAFPPGIDASPAVKTSATCVTDGGSAPLTCVYP